ncbi:uncharacterized protein LOC125186689 [Salvia hispanica]|uniref:uncharacterized protein LOC125186689 n=1 Tax=Salvia hispanica TaxID=49212 RepID=UPI00200929F2|nr:uncharacterized protein LOC125186689 [Salvia hispanica]
MAAPGQDSAKKVQGPPPEGGYQGTPRPGSATQHYQEVLHQQKKLPVCPAKAAIAGFAFMSVIGYFTLYTKKKPEATALDVAKVTSGTATPQNTRPRN